LWRGSWSSLSGRQRKANCIRALRRRSKRGRRRLGRLRIDDRHRKRRFHLHLRRRWFSRLQFSDHDRQHISNRRADHAFGFIHPSDGVEFLLRFLLQASRSLHALDRAFLFEGLAARTVQSERPDGDNRHANKERAAAEENKEAIGRASG
jgi:hypothetical protein